MWKEFHLEPPSEIERESQMVQESWEIPMECQMGCPRESGLEHLMGFELVTWKGTSLENLRQSLMEN